MSLLVAMIVAAPLRVLFLGNSHTQFNDVPKLVAALGRERGRVISPNSRSGPTLYDMYGDPQIHNAVSSGLYEVIVLQAQAISTSHRFTYSNKEAIALAKAGRQAGAKVFLFSEWPRKGIDETSYIEGIYRKIAEASGAKIIPVGRVWDAVLREQKGSVLWAQDGNHASPLGSRVAAYAIYRAITQDKEAGYPSLDLGKEQASLFWKAAGLVLD